MPPRRRGRDLFEELGLLAQEQETNPFTDLGISVELARQLLDENSKGDTLRFVATGMYRTLSRVYHPDIDPSKTEYFKKISGANTRVEKAKKDELMRWTRREQTIGTAKVSQEQSRREVIASRAAQLLSVNMELGSHPQHFSQLRWAQGVLLRHKEATLLARPAKEGLQVIKGEEFALDRARLPVSRQTQAFDFQRFLLQHHSFGLEPETNIAAYIDDTGRATLLNTDLSFMMDITDPVSAYRRRRVKSTRAEREAADGADGWTRSTDPGLLFTQVPGPTSLTETQSKFISFPLSKKLTFNRSVPLDVAGSIEDTEFFRTVRFNRSAGAAALGGRKSMPAHFGMTSVPALQLIEQDPQYTPLIAPGNSLLLFDPRSRLPVVTDAEIIGMIGNGAQV